MNSGLRAYFDLIFRQHDCYGTWLPGSRVELGEIGKLSKNGTLIHTGSLKERASMPKPRDVAEPPQTLATSGGVTFSAGVDVATDKVIDVLARGSVKMQVSFTRSDAAVMVLEDLIRHEFADELPVRALMQQLYNNKKLSEDELVVTYVLEAKSGVVMTMYDSKTGGDVKIDANLGKSTITLAKVSGHLEIVSTHSSQTTAVATADRSLTPMYRALVFRRNRRWRNFWRSTLDIQSGISTRQHLGPDKPGSLLSGSPKAALADPVPDV